MILLFHLFIAFVSQHANAELARFDRHSCSQESYSTVNKSNFVQIYLSDFRIKKNCTLDTLVEVDVVTQFYKCTDLDVAHSLQSSKDIPENLFLTFSNLKQEVFFHLDKYFYKKPHSHFSTIILPLRTFLSDEEIVKLTKNLIDKKQNIPVNFKFQFKASDTVAEVTYPVELATKLCTKTNWF